MYFDKFINNPKVDKACRYVLSGDDEFLKDLVIKEISRISGRSLQRITEGSFKPVVGGLFDSGKVYVLSNSTKCSSFCDGIIKLSNSRITQTYTKAGFTEIYCALFSNQIPNYIDSLLYKYGLPSSLVSKIHETCGDDTYSIYNAIIGLSFLDRSQLDLTTVERYCSNLIILDNYKVIDYFAQGNYRKFVVSISRDRVDLFEIINLLLNLILSSQKLRLSGMKAYSLYDKKLLNVAHRLEPYRLEVIISYLGELYGSYADKRSVICMKLQKLIYYLSGMTTKL